MKKVVLYLILFIVFLIKSNVVAKEPLSVNIKTSKLSNDRTAASATRSANVTGPVSGAWDTLKISEDFKLQMKLCVRSLYLFILFLPTLLLSPLAYTNPWFREAVWFPLLRLTIAWSGAAFIKWGQWASCRPDIFSQTLCDQLAVLQADAPRHSFTYTKDLLRAELGSPVDEVFRYFPPDPIASGSIAQVYKAEIKWPLSLSVCNTASSTASCEKSPKFTQNLPEDTKWITVAVKVRHPNVEEIINLDFKIMAQLAHCLDVFPSLRSLRLGESMSQFSSSIAAQTSLFQEGKHLQKFNRYFDHSQWADVGFPEPIFLSESVLIESFIPGKSVKAVSDIVRKEWESQPNGGSQLDVAHFIVTRGEDLYLKMLLQDGLMHSDLHPGNIIFSPISENMKMKVSLVDAGLVAEPLLEEQDRLIGLLGALGEGRGDRAADCIIGFSKVKLAEADAVAFRGDMVELFQRACRGFHTNVVVADVIKGILQLVQKHHLSISANYVTLLMNIICLDGLAQQLLPKYNVLDGAKWPLRLHGMLARVPFRVQIMKALFPIIMNMKKATDAKFLVNFRRALTDKRN